MKKLTSIGIAPADSAILDAHRLQEMYKQNRADLRRNITAPYEPQKEYPRFPKIQLANAPLPATPLQNVLEERKSWRDFSNTTPISFDQLSALLHYSVGTNNARPLKDPGRSIRFFPSGGGRYATEAYVYIQNVEHVTPGLYHYNIREHALETLLENSKTPPSRDWLTYPWSHTANAVVIITMVWRRHGVKYFNFGSPLSLIEVGSALQNMTLAAAALRLACCPLAGFRDDVVEDMLDIDTSGESPALVVALGAELAGNTSI